MRGVLLTVDPRRQWELFIAALVFIFMGIWVFGGFMAEEEELQLYWSEYCFFLFQRMKCF